MVGVCRWKRESSPNLREKEEPEESVLKPGNHILAVAWETSWDQEVVLSLVARVELDSQTQLILPKQSEVVGVVLRMPGEAEGSHELQEIGKCPVDHFLEGRSCWAPAAEMQEVGVAQVGPQNANRFDKKQGACRSLKGADIDL